jgi:hypothetical protein
MMSINQAEKIAKAFVESELVYRVDCAKAVGHRKLRFDITKSPVPQWAWIVLEWVLEENGYKLESMDKEHVMFKITW